MELEGWLAYFSVSDDSDRERKLDAKGKAKLAALMG